MQILWGRHPAPFVLGGEPLGPGEQAFEPFGSAPGPLRRLRPRPELPARRELREAVAAAEPAVPDGPVPPAPAGPFAPITVGPPGHPDVVGAPANPQPVPWTKAWTAAGHDPPLPDALAALDARWGVGRMVWPALGDELEDAPEVRVLDGREIASELALARDVAEGDPRTLLGWADGEGTVAVPFAQVDQDGAVWWALFCADGGVRVASDQDAGEVVIAWAAPTEVLDRAFTGALNGQFAVPQAPAGTFVKRV